MAKRKAGGPLLAGVGVVLVGAVAFGTFSGGSKSVKTADTGGGATAAPSGAPAPYAITTLPPVGTAAQDPGGGGGGTGVPGNVAPPGIQGAHGSGSAQGYSDAGDVLYFSGISTLDPNRSATTSGENSFGGNPATGAVGGLTGGSSTSGNTTGCANPGSEVDYYGIPLRNVVSYRGDPQAHIRISGGGVVTVKLFQQLQDGTCQLIGQGSSGISGGVADVTIGAPSHAFPVGSIPSVVVGASGQHTISTSSQNPSYLYLPNLNGV